MEGIIRFVPLKMGEWMRFCDLIVMHLWDYKMILGMNFLTQAEVSIMPYLRILAFMERGTSCTVITIEEDATDARNLTRLESLTRPSGSWWRNVTMRVQIIESLWVRDEKKWHVIARMMNTLNLS